MRESKAGISRIRTNTGPGPPVFNPCCDQLAWPPEAGKEGTGSGNGAVVPGRVGKEGSMSSSSWCPGLLVYTHLSGRRMVPAAHLESPDL